MAEATKRRSAWFPWQHPLVSRGKPRGGVKCNQMPLALFFFFFGTFARLILSGPSCRSQTTPPPVYISCASRRSQPGSIDHGVDCVRRSPRGSDTSIAAFQMIRAQWAIPQRQWTGLLYERYRRKGALDVRLSRGSWSSAWPPLSPSPARLPLSRSSGGDLPAVRDSSERSGLRRGKLHAADNCGSPEIRNRLGRPDF